MHRIQNMPITKQHLNDTLRSNSFSPAAVQNQPKAARSDAENKKH